MSINDALGQRMKTYYEAIPKNKLMRRTPVAIRLDGKAFHTFTRGFQKPFDDILVRSMQATMLYLCENIQNCVFGFCQSDEITLILVDYQTLTTEAWFDYEVQKLCSISASMATLAFNCFFKEAVDIWDKQNGLSGINYFNEDKEPALVKLHDTYWDAYHKGAMFDARCFNIPKEEVCNLIFWRQLDATRNSIQMVGQANFSQTELHGKSCNEIQDMLMTQKGINWNNFPAYLKRGAACRKMPVEIVEEPCNNIAVRHNWVIDLDMPILKGEDRKYVEDLIFVGE